MDARRAWPAGGHTLDASQQEVWLLGQPPLGRYLDYVEDFVTGGDKLPRRAQVEDWRRANDYYYKLEKSEAGIANRVRIRKLPPAMAAAAQEVEEDARFKRAFDTLPTRIALVELDRLIVAQPHVNLDHAERLKARLPRDPSPQDLFRFCLPLNRVEADVEMRRAGKNRFMFWSASSDFRFLEPALLRSDQVSDYDPYGPIGGIVGLTVGYGSNFLSAIEADGRVLLHNGHHRAYTLRDLGHKFAPCIIQTVTRRDELGIVASRTVNDDPAFFFKSARPPLLKDFFDPHIRKVLRVPKTLRVVELTFEVKETEIKDFSMVG
jgi:hypothetical protein